MKLTPAQSKIFLDQSRFKVVCAGRRFGKSFLSLCTLLHEAATQDKALCWYVAPTYRQAKQIAWKMLKEFAPRGFVVATNETDLSLTFKNGSVIALRGADNYDSLRGVGLNALVLDEFADMDESAWAEVLRPALSDKQGRALFIGTPAGYNHFYQLWIDAHHKADWSAYQFTTAQGGNVLQPELDAARLDLDDRTYRQEYEASFESLTGRVYYAFDRVQNVSADLVDTGAELLVGMDFNINPMSAVIACKAGGQLHAFDEITINNGNTELMAAQLKARYPGRSIVVYPDPSGKARKTSAPVGQTDFSILRDHGFRVVAPHSAPLVVDRINTVNALFCNSAGVRRLLIHPRCKQTVKSFDGLTYKDGTNQPDKALGLDHLVDALGYTVCELFPLIKNTVTTTDGW